MPEAPNRPVSGGAPLAPGADAHTRSVSGAADADTRSVPGGEPHTGSLPGGDADNRPVPGGGDAPNRPEPGANTHSRSVSGGGEPRTGSVSGGDADIRPVSGGADADARSVSGGGDALNRPVSGGADADTGSVSGGGDAPSRPEPAADAHARPVPAADALKRPVPGADTHSRSVSGGGEPRTGSVSGGDADIRPVSGGADADARSVSGGGDAPNRPVSGGADADTGSVPGGGAVLNRPEPAPDTHARPEPGADNSPEPGAAAPELTGGDARQVVAELARAGALAALYGARPTGRLDPGVLRRLLAEAAARGPQGTVLALLVQLATALPLLSETASTPTATSVRDAALEGRALLALAATDEQAGSDLTALATTVDLEGAPDQVTVNGTKRWVTSALTADHALVLARHRPGRHFTNFTWVLVPLTAPGVTVRPAETALFQGSGVGHLDLSGVVLSRDHLLGRTGRGLALFARHMAVERLASAAWAIELCRRAIADTDRRLRTRQVDDAPLRESASVRQRLAACAVQVSSLHALWTASAERIVTRYDATAAAVLKAASGATVDSVMAVCAQLQGADGFGTGGIQELRAEAAVFAIGGGATEVVLDTVAGRLDTVLNDLTP